MQGSKFTATNPGKESKDIKLGIPVGTNTHTSLASDLVVPKCLLLIKTKLSVRVGSEPSGAAGLKHRSTEGRWSSAQAAKPGAQASPGAAASHLVAVVVHGDQAVKVEDMAAFHQLPHQVRLDGRLRSLVARGCREALHADGAVLCGRGGDGSDGQMQPEPYQGHRADELPCSCAATSTHARSHAITLGHRRGWPTHACGTQLVFGGGRGQDRAMRRTRRPLHGTGASPVSPVAPPRAKHPGDAPAQPLLLTPHPADAAPSAGIFSVPPPGFYLQESKSQRGRRAARGKPTARGSRRGWRGQRNHVGKGGQNRGQVPKCLSPFLACFLVVLRQVWEMPGMDWISLLLTGGGCSTSLGGRVRQTGSPAALIRIPVIPGQRGLKWH